MIPWQQASEAEKELVKHGELRCWLALLGVDDSDAVPAIVRLDSGDSSITVDLFASGPGWVTEIGGRGSMILRGWTVEGGHEFTLIEPYISRAVPGNDGYEARRLSGGSLVLGAHVQRDSVWSTVRYRTGRLHEWFGDSGLRNHQELNADHQVTAVSHVWTRPEPIVIARSEAEVTVRGILAERERANRLSPTASMRSDTEVVVKPSVPGSADELYREYGIALLAFSAVASSRPDWILLDVLCSGERKQTVRYIHQGFIPTEWSWSSKRERFLFTAEDIDDPGDLLGRWFDLWPSVREAAATYGEALREEIYTRSRVTELVASLETYWEAKFHTGGRRPNLVNRLKALVAHSQIDPEVLAATDAQLRDLTSARHLYAHLSRVSRGEQERLDEMLIDNARRAALLFQACLLRDLEVSPETATGWIERHLRNWPIA